MGGNDPVGIASEGNKRSTEPIGEIIHTGKTGMTREKTGGEEKRTGEGSGFGTAYGSLHQGAHVRTHERVARA